MWWLPELNKIEETPAMTGGREWRDAPDSEPSCLLPPERRRRPGATPWLLPGPSGGLNQRRHAELRWWTSVCWGNREEERGSETELGFGDGARRFIRFRGRRLESRRSRAPGRRHWAASSIGRLKKTLLPYGSHWSGSYRNGMACRARCWAGLVGRLGSGKLFPFF
jgi:hypothetical protein